MSQSDAVTELMGCYDEEIYSLCGMYGEYFVLVKVGVSVLREVGVGKCAACRYYKGRNMSWLFISRGTVHVW